MKHYHWTKWPNLKQAKQGLHWANVWKIKRDLLGYKQGKRYHIVYEVAARGEKIYRVIRPHGLPDMTWEEMTAEFRYIPNEQPLSKKKKKDNKFKIIME